MTTELPEQPVEEARTHAELASVPDASLTAAAPHMPTIRDDEDVDDLLEDPA